MNNVYNGFEEDLDLFFVDFGEQCEGKAGDFVAIFGRAFYEFEGIDDERTVATCRTDQIKDYRRGDTFTSLGRTYTIKAKQPDGAITALIVY